jgi:hypothetical protein
MVVMIFAAHAPVRAAHPAIGVRPFYGVGSVEARVFPTLDLGDE